MALVHSIASIFFALFESFKSPETFDVFPAIVLSPLMTDVLLDLESLVSDVLLDLDSASPTTPFFDVFPSTVGRDVDDLKLPGSDIVGLSKVGLRVGNQDVGT